MLPYFLLIAFGATVALSAPSEDDIMREMSSNMRELSDLSDMTALTSLTDQYRGPDDLVVRAKRNYYGGYDYGWGGDYWYAGRIFGIIVGALLFLSCCCLPCICLLGIWFLGWFGIKRKREAKMQNQQQYGQQSQPPPANIVHLHSEPQPVQRTIIRDPPRASFSTSEPERVIYAAEDRYFTTSTSPHNSRI